MTDELFVVELKELPVDILSRAQDHNLTLVREMALVHTADERGVAPARLLWLSHHLDQRYAAFNGAPRQRLQKAIEGDESHVDVTYRVPADAADAAIELGAALDEVDEYCKTGDLLTLVTPPDALAFRRWLLNEFVVQLRSRRGANAMDSVNLRRRRRATGAQTTETCRPAPKPPRTRQRSRSSKIWTWREPRGFVATSRTCSTTACCTSPSTSRHARSSIRSASACC